MNALQSRNAADLDRIAAHLVAILDRDFRPTREEKTFILKLAEQRLVNRVRPASRTVYALEADTVVPGIRA